MFGFGMEERIAKPEARQRRHTASMAELGNQWRNMDEAEKGMFAVVSHVYKPAPAVSA